MPTSRLSYRALLIPSGVSRQRAAECARRPRTRVPGGSANPCAPPENRCEQNRARFGSVQYVGSAFRRTCG